MVPPRESSLGCGRYNPGNNQNLPMTAVPERVAGLEQPGHPMEYTT